MVNIKCDGCGKELIRGELRYTVKIDVRAAYDKLEVGLADLVRDHRAEMIALIEKLKDKDPRKIEETVYKNFTLDLCPQCQRAYIKDPIRFHPEQGDPPDFDVDAFLRSMDLDKP
ncbi:MAG: hypothetical protein AMXMBFR84_01550 [Candidatus Hydrogenedentota bacterium]